MARQKGWKVEGQKEQGKEGTVHYQLILRTPQVRFAAVKKAFPRAHIEVARNVSALRQYVNKEETRISGLATKDSQYPSQARYFELLWDEILNNPDVSEYSRGPKGRFTAPRNAMIRATSQLIKQGYFVESVACNPMTISAWDLYHDSFLVRKETTRQTDKEKESCVQIPTINDEASDIEDAASQGEASDDQGSSAAFGNTDSEEDDEDSGSESSGSQGSW